MVDEDLHSKVMNAESAAGAEAEAGAATSIGSEASEGRDVSSGGNAKVTSSVGVASNASVTSSANGNASAVSSDSESNAERFAPVNWTFRHVAWYVAVYAAIELLLAISCVASIENYAASDTVPAFAGLTISTRLAMLVTGLAFAGNCLLCLLFGWLGHRAGADMRRASPAVIVAWCSAAVGLLAALVNQGTSGAWETWFSMLINVIIAIYATRAARASRYI